MFRLIRSIHIWPPRQPPQSFELLKIGSFKFPSRLAKTVFKCPTKRRIWWKRQRLVIKSEPQILSLNLERLRGNSIQFLPRYHSRFFHQRRENERNNHNMDSPRTYHEKCIENGMETVDTDNKMLRAKLPFNLLHNRHRLSKTSQQFCAQFFVTNFTPCADLHAVEKTKTIC